MDSEPRKPEEPKVKQFNLARFIKDAVRKMPNAIRGELVKRNGKQAVKVEFKKEDAA